MFVQKGMACLMTVCSWMRGCQIEVTVRFFFIRFNPTGDGAKLGQTKAHRTKCKQYEQEIHVH